MKIVIIGSTGYRGMMEETLKEELKKGNICRMAFFDDTDLSEYELIEKNKEMISEADVVYVFWDGRSVGTVFDLGMCFALNKKIVIKYLNSKSFVNFLKQYEEKSREGSLGE